MTNLNQLEKRLSKYNLKNEEASSLKGGGWGSFGGCNPNGGNQQGGGNPPPTFAFAAMNFSYSINP